MADDSASRRRGRRGRGAARPGRTGPRARPAADPRHRHRRHRPQGLGPRRLGRHGGRPGAGRRRPTRWRPRGTPAWWRGWPSWSGPSPRPTGCRPGFPGMVRTGDVLSAPHFVTESGPGSKVDPRAGRAWSRLRPRPALCRRARQADPGGQRRRRPGRGGGPGHGPRVRDHARHRASAPPSFLDGRLLPHLEIAHQPFRKGETYNEQLGERTRKDIGDDRWNTPGAQGDQTSSTHCSSSTTSTSAAGNARRVPARRAGRRPRQDDDRRQQRRDPGRHPPVGGSTTSGL